MTGKSRESNGNNKGQSKQPQLPMGGVRRITFRPVRMGVNDDLREALMAEIELLVEHGGHIPHTRYHAIGIQHLLYALQQYCGAMACGKGREHCLEPNDGALVEENAWRRVAEAIVEAQKCAEANEL